MRTTLSPFLLGFLLLALLAELILHALPVSTGYNLGAVDAREPILRGQPYSAYTYSRGWNFQLENSGVLNNFGFRSSYDYAPDPRAVVVIGNSFIQADAILPRDTMTERLQEMSGAPTYAVGVDGFSLADYLAAARWSSATFDAHTLLVLLTTGDLKHSCLPRLGEHYLRSADGAISLVLVERRSSSRLKQLLNDSRLFRYVFDNLRVSANWTKGWRRQTDGEPAPEAAAADRGCGDKEFENAASRFLLDSFHELESTRHARVLFLLAPGYRREQGVVAGGIRDVDSFADRAAHDGFAVVHLDAAFSAALRSGTRLDFLPIDGHWSVAANALAAQAAAEAISHDLP
jgi:hypothetical protein